MSASTQSSTSGGPSVIFSANDAEGDTEHASRDAAPNSVFFENDTTQSLIDRSLTYLRACIPVHLRGPAGTGKTTLAFQIATMVGRPSVLVTGDAWMKSSDLIGREAGVRSRQVVDKYIQSVRKVESETSPVWADGILVTAMICGYTFIYDEFTRSPAEANNALLMALEERMVVITHPDRKSTYIHAHPEFRAIFTSNPSDYAGVQTVQDALLDRMITLNLEGHDVETEAGIVAAKSGIDVMRAAQIVRLVRAVTALPEVPDMPSIRSAIMIAQIVSTNNLTISAQDGGFIQLCLDVFYSKARSTLPTNVFRPEFMRQLYKAISDCLSVAPSPTKSKTIRPANLSGAAA
jgi:nitric oxide reductase NorQ protein